MEKKKGAWAKTLSKNWSGLIHGDLCGLGFDKPIDSSQIVR